jgi:hypothetical protein
MKARLLLMTLVALLAAAGARAQVAGLGDVRLTSDSDDFDALRIRGGALMDYESAFHYAGVEVQTTHYTQRGWQSDAPAALFVWRRQNRDTLAGTAGEAGVVRVSGRNRLIGDATWSLRPSAHTGVELIASGDLVETQRALEEATSYTFAAASIDQTLGQRITAVALGGVQHFSDGNDRVHLRGRLIVGVLPKAGLNAQLRWRQSESSRLDAGNSYFNPEHYRQWDAGVTMRKRHAGWIWSGTLAAGREEIDRSVQQATRFAELRAEGPVAKGRLAFYATYNRSAGFALSPDYSYRVFGVTFTIPF